MATLVKGYSFGATESVTNAKLHLLVDSATITGIVDADVAVGAAISFSKIAQAAIDGSKLTGLANIVSGAGVIPAVNLTSVAQKGANSDITSLTGLTTALSVAQGGTGATAAANAANGVVVLNASSQLPAVSGALLTNLPSTALGSWATKSDNTAYLAATDGFVVGYRAANGIILGYTDASNPPTTKRWGQNTQDGYSTSSSICMPVKKGDYWKTDGATGALFWIPLGS